MPGTDDPGVVYLIHFDRPVRGKRHYLGWSTDHPKREREHGTARGARLTRQVRLEGVDFRVVRTWVGGPELERKLKKRSHADRLCPVCIAERKDHEDESD